MVDIGRFRLICDKIWKYISVRTEGSCLHALKSSLRIIGSEALGEEAQGLEDAGKRGDTDYITALLEEKGGRA